MASVLGLSVGCWGYIIFTSVNDIDSNSESYRISNFRNFNSAGFTVPARQDLMARNIKRYRRERERQASWFDCCGNRRRPFESM